MKNRVLCFTYFYTDITELLNFFRIPRLLITSPSFRQLSPDSKLLYGLMLDRMGLSAKNGRYDDLGRVYIYYTLEEIQEDLNCGHNKAIKLLAELDAEKGLGLIERVKQGQGRPCRIYVKQFTTAAVPPSPEPEAPPEPGSPDVSKQELQTSEKRKSGRLKTGSAEFPKRESSYTDRIYTEKNHTDPSIYPSCGPPNREVCRRMWSTRRLPWRWPCVISCCRAGARSEYTAAALPELCRPLFPRNCCMTSKQKLKPSWAKAAAISCPSVPKAASP